MMYMAQRVVKNQTSGPQIVFFVSIQWLEYPIVEPQMASSWSPKAWPQVNAVIFKVSYGHSARNNIQVAGITMFNCYICNML